MAKHIRTLNSESLQTTAKTGGWGWKAYRKVGLFVLS